MLTIEKGDNEIKRGRQKKSFFADVLWILKTDHRLSRTLDWKNIDISEFRIIHGWPQIGNSISGKGSKWG
jgi:hypothetical protein